MKKPAAWSASAQKPPAPTAGRRHNSRRPPRRSRRRRSRRSGMRRASSSCSTPICDQPRAAPAPSARPMRGRRGGAAELRAAVAGGGKRVDGTLEGLPVHSEHGQSLPDSMRALAEDEGCAQFLAGRLPDAQLRDGDPQGKNAGPGPRFPHEKDVTSAAGLRVDPLTAPAICVSPAQARGSASQSTGQARRPIAQ